ncbi:conserved hypothetical protein [Pseudarthrobacter chlorophenolicus A6]|uniref:DUF3846 domain-containing protein n=1 Tax=Pseudarthrobacter chlorophenolicus (strain ATCC 700700 / DSM 12829 / CIP 107037 / JCM 12360 / KCTC 9906 / NCIMB 13794 / A6) TaxID=452863 RepID=B8HGM1_PSECP|nr:hypothetical protein [Pseudarthrobacter chlorophenolicus]ACL41287.1 conserved hypothetical protein [Pseudarthrobacter chlorophenolicus A6]SDQ66893.1 hypothetical protein SAMN04489738_2150 [Pseudarthrobacter chlorophenolicus]
MNQLLNALVIPARLNHPVHIRPLQLDAASRQRVAAGEVAVLAGKDWRAYLSNESGRTFHNVRAEVLLREAGVDVESTIHGTVTFLGQAEPWEETDAPRHLIRLAEQLFDMPLAA